MAPETNKTDRSLAKASRAAARIVGRVLLVLALIAVVAQISNTDLLTIVVIKVGFCGILAITGVWLLNYGSRAAMRMTRSARLKMRCFQIVGTLLLVYGVDHLLSTIRLYHEGLDLITCVIQGGLAVGSWILGISCIKRARKQRYVNGLELTNQDGRQPVLYLRPFRDDQVTRRVIGSELFMPSRMKVGTLTEEEQLGLLVSKIGPFIAIGIPGEKLPELGALRGYVDDRQWEEWVQQYMSRPALVILRAGATPGIVREVELASSIVAPERLVLLVPATAGAYEAFCAAAEGKFPLGLPHLSNSTTESQVGSVKGIIWFDSDWTPHLTSLAVPPWHSAARVLAVGRPLLPSLIAAFAPVFRSLGLPLPQMQPNWALVTVLVILGALMVAYAGFFVWVLFQR